VLRRTAFMRVSCASARLQRHAAADRFHVSQLRERTFATSCAAADRFHVSQLTWKTGSWYKYFHICISQNV